MNKSTILTLITAGVGALTLGYALYTQWETTNVPARVQN